MDQSYSQLSCLMLGMKLQTAAKLDDVGATAQLVQVAKELRECLITLGKRKRKVRKPKEVQSENGETLTTGKKKKK